MEVSIDLVCIVIIRAFAHNFVKFGFNYCGLGGLVGCFGLHN